MTDVIHHTTSEMQVSALAQRLRGWINGQLAQNARVTLALSGGRSPIPLFALLARQAWPWDRIDITLVDERVVPPDHLDSNARLLREHLLLGAASAARFLPMIEAGELTLGPEALRIQAEQRLRDVLQQPLALVLGMGTDGHTASLFAQAAGYDAACSSTDWLAWLDPRPHAPHARLSLTLHALKTASLRLLSIAGHDKQAVLERALASPDAALPISLLLHDPSYPVEVHQAP
jgi:6-phosphogluconolactonase